ncbi:hypothetical protein PVAG01_00307 [Phlyctema vagabunda]|uniref:Alpha/beta hydrolase fold-3 domain-containing protein n=1 Tax=Phlyctema vagabunda TaxID=108571 RepID=A0ABR4PTW1_9HELO
MLMGSASMSEIENGAYVMETGVPFFSVEYRLAPEHKHPVPEELGIDSSRIGFMGQSVGGGVAVGVALMARDRKVTPPLAKQILLYPMIDHRPSVPGPAVQPRITWDSDDNRTCWAAVLGSDNVGTSEVSPYAAAARPEEVSGMPSTYIDVGNLDIFWAPCMLYAQKLAAEGVATEFHLYSGVPHAFELMAPAATISKTAQANRIRALKSF